MPNKRKPRAGSMQFYPRVRSRRETARVRSWITAKESKLLGFAGYKVGMTHAIVTDNLPNSLTKGQELFVPLTIIECPPLKIVSIKFYKILPGEKRVVGEVYADTLDKEFSRSAVKPSKTKKIDDVKEYDDVALMVETQPKLTGIGKKSPELFEVALGGSTEEKLTYAIEKLGKEISVKDVFKEGQLVDVHAVTTGKGFQGPMKRFGITRRRHKSEKAIRNPGSLGAWEAQGKTMWRIAHAGKMGYHTRTEYNKWLVKIGEKPEELKMDGGMLHYGVIKNHYLLVKGSVAGRPKRLVRLNDAIRANPKIPKNAPQIQYISLASKQGN
jgi:large subunit ribosomal protein L3